MINLDFGITYMKSEDGVTYFEGKERQIYLVTEFSKELNSIRHNFAIARSQKTAWEGITEISQKDGTDYDVVSCHALYDMLIELVKVIQ